MSQIWMEPYDANHMDSSDPMMNDMHYDGMMDQVFRATDLEVLITVRF